MTGTLSAGTALWAGERHPNFVHVVMVSLSNHDDHVFKRMSSFDELRMALFQSTKGEKHGKDQFWRCVGRGRDL
jgi:hypothetical protein